jgi:hypothetical protein
MAASGADKRLLPKAQILNSATTVRSRGGRYRRDVATLAALVAAAVLPGFTPFAAGPDGGQVLRGTFPGGGRPGFVYLPPGFDASVRYPVIYLLHGMPGSPSEYLDGTQLAEFADDGISAGRLRPFIAILPAAGPNRGYNGEWAGPLESVAQRAGGERPTEDRPSRQGCARAHGDEVLSLERPRSQSLVQAGRDGRLRE